MWAGAGEPGGGSKQGRQDNLGSATSPGGRASGLGSRGRGFGNKGTYGDTHAWGGGDGLRAAEGQPPAQAANQASGP